MNIICNRGKQVSLETLPKYSIALDGFVNGPQLDPDNHRFSFDHHAGCLRFCTTATCMQAWYAVATGLDPEQYTIYINDVDLDVCAAIWILKNPDRCKEPLVKKFIDAVGLADMSAGALGYNGMTKIVEWIAAPETDSKRNKDYEKLSDEGLLSILEAILHRIDLYVNGESGAEIVKQPKHGEYKILRNEKDWVLVESNDPHVYGALYQCGFEKIVLTRPLSDGSLAVSLAKKSDFVEDFPLHKMYEEFNKIEPGWGGSSSCGGAVRNPDGSRSRLPIEKIIEIIDFVVEESKKS